MRGEQPREVEFLFDNVFGLFRSHTRSSGRILSNIWCGVKKKIQLLVCYESAYLAPLLAGWSVRSPAERVPMGDLGFPPLGPDGAR